MLNYVSDTAPNDVSSDDIDNQSSDNYLYDGNGNILTDIGDGVGFVFYDINNLPVEIVKTDNSQITNNIFGNDNIGQIKRNGSSLKRYYYLKDHLGSIKMIVNTGDTMVGYNDYHPYGGILSGRSEIPSDADARYKFTGKERDSETGLDYFGARYYNSWSGQWEQVDPKQDKYPTLSPYTYCHDNPINRIDPNGMQDGGPGNIFSQLMNTVSSIFNYFSGNNSNENLSNEGEVRNAPAVKALVASEKVTEGITKKAAQVKAGVRAATKEEYNIIYVHGPTFLNKTSEGVTDLGLAVGGGFLATGQEEIGLPIISSTFVVSTRLDAAATGLTAIDYAFNGGSDRLNKFKYQFTNLYEGGAFGRAIEGLAGTVKTYYPIYSPLIY